jgi:hypothetical protein
MNGLCGEAAALCTLLGDGVAIEEAATIVYQ